MANERRTAPPDSIRDCLSYDRSTGAFMWIKARRGVVVGRAGCVQPNGYRVICFQRVKYLASHLAWWFSYGEWPTFVIDHKNRLQSDDRLENLRRATHSKNHLNEKLRSNNKSGFRGVCSVNRRGRQQWLAFINKDGHFNYLGYFDSARSAAVARDAAALKLFGEFAVLNLPSSEAAL